MEIIDIKVKTKDTDGDKFVGLRNDLYNYKGVHAEVTDKTSNSIEVFLKAKKQEGVNCHQWMTFDAFRKTFL